MSVGPLGGVPASAAGGPLAQTRGSETERAGHESTEQQRQTDGSTRADRAAGIGQTAEDQEASERDADGRRLWERGAERPAADEAAEQVEPPPTNDPDGASGNSLDLTG